GRQSEQDRRGILNLNRAVARAVIRTNAQIPGTHPERHRQDNQEKQSLPGDRDASADHRPLPFEMAAICTLWSYAGSWRTSAKAGSDKTPCKSFPLPIA